MHENKSFTTLNADKLDMDWMSLMVACHRP